MSEDNDEESRKVVRASSEGVQARESFTETEKGESSEVKNQKQEGMAEFREKERE